MSQRPNQHPNQRYVFFATCAPGLEPVLHAEACALGLEKLERQIGGVRFEGRLHEAWRANLWLRTAVRVLLRLERFEARDAETLYEKTQEVDWSRFLVPDGRLVVDAQSRDSVLVHTRFLEQRVKDAVVDQFRAQSGVRPSIDKDDPDLRIHVHVTKNRVTLSADSSGHSLHKRGWRRYQGRAPLAETLAAGLVLFSGWDRRAPLLDPFCGSATILIEAAMIAGQVAPGLTRKEFGFERWLGHDRAGFEALVAAAREKIQWPKKLRILGWDSDPGRLEGARSNLAAAELDERVELEAARIDDFAPRPGWNAWIVTNPPYGERVGSVAELEGLYRRLGGILRERCSGYQLALLCGNRELVRHLNLRGQRTALRNGALECELLRARLN